PPEDFKMIRRFGLYSRRHKKKKPKKFKLFKDKISWAERIFKTFKTNLCFATLFRFFPRLIGL
ncbi:MAG: hypothetical protein ACRCZO_03240, partial [Cetobacterium sp.]